MPIFFASISIRAPIILLLTPANLPLPFLRFYQSGFLFFLPLVFTQIKSSYHALVFLRFGVSLSLAWLAQCLLFQSISSLKLTFSQFARSLSTLQSRVFWPSSFTVASLNSFDVSLFVEKLVCAKC